MGKNSNKKEAEGIVLIIGVVVYLFYMLVVGIVKGVSDFFTSNGDIVLQIIIYMLAVGFPIILVYQILKFVKNRRESLVKTRSILINKLDDLNLGFTFREVNTEYGYRDSHPNKRKFDRDTPSKFAERHIYGNLNYYVGLLDDIQLNLSGYSDYTIRYNGLKELLGKTDITDEKLKGSRFNKIELNLYKRLKLDQPITKFRVMYKITYTSPQGRNHYAEYMHLNSDEIERVTMKIKRDIEYKSSRQYTIQLERSKLSDGLRYDIMSRDKFKCQICGSTQNDGVKLHVDHIYPVSKGGKTITSNLRTLCDRCNIGKSNKIEKAR